MGDDQLAVDSGDGSEDGSPLPTEPRTPGCAAPTDPPTGPRSDRPPNWQRAVHIYALFGMSIAQTVLLVLSKNPGFWVVRRANVVDIALFLVTVLVAIPAILIGIPYLLGRLNATLGWVMHLVVCGGLATLFFTDLLGNIFGIDSSGLGLAIGSIVATVVLLVAYKRVQIVRDLLLAIAVAPLAVSVVFFLDLPPIGSNDVSPVDLGIEKDNPVVVLVLDAFSVPVLLDHDETIDSSRFPNFSRLAATSTWYPYASSTHDGTLFAVPAILTGKVAPEDSLPIAADHPTNLFTALVDTHSMVVFEDVTRLCPDRLCASTRTRPSPPHRWWTLMQDAAVVYLHAVVPHDFHTVLGVPGVGIRWQNFLTAEDAVAATYDAGPIEHQLTDRSGGERRAQGIGRFIDTLDGSDPALYYLHVDLPHLPYSLLPDGRWFRWSGGLSAIDDGQWVGDEWTRQQALAQYSLTIGYTDLVLGVLLDKLEAEGMFDDALIVVVSDHGASFMEREPRRFVTAGNFAALANVPLFIKYPGQRVGVIDDRNAGTVDVLPTIVDVLGGELQSDGSSLLAPERENAKRMESRDGPPVIVEFDDFRQRVAALRAEIGETINVGLGHAAVVAGIGPVPEIHGLSAVEVGVGEVTGTVSLLDANEINHLDMSVTRAMVVADVAVDDLQPQYYALVVGGNILGTASAVVSDLRTPRADFLVDPDSLAEADGLVEVMALAKRVDGSWGLLRIVPPR